MPFSPTPFFFFLHISSLFHCCCCLVILSRLSESCSILSSVLLLEHRSELERHNTNIAARRRWVTGSQSLYRHLFLCLTVARIFGPVVLKVRLCCRILGLILSLAGPLVANLVCTGVQDHHSKFLHWDGSHKYTFTYTDIMHHFIGPG